MIVRASVAYTTTMWLGRTIAFAEKLATKTWNGSDGGTLITV